MRNWFFHREPQLREGDEPVELNPPSRGRPRSTAPNPETCLEIADHLETLDSEDLRSLCYRYFPGERDGWSG